MFIGHFALGFAAKRWTPALSLAVLFAAAQFADLLWPVLIALGIEQVRIDPGNTVAVPLDFVSYPYSHSLVMLVIWGALFGWIATKNSSDRRAFAVVWALVVSHWLLDVVTHRPDMPVYPGGPKLGLGLWNHANLERAIEVAMYAAGVILYARATSSRDAIGEVAFWSLAVLLPAGFLASSAPPPSVTALWATAMVGSVIILLWSRWADRHREMRV
jgi:membrane-bound metal-dependent hydrolase YbcI (DUF457 family)